MFQKPESISVTEEKDVPIGDIMKGKKLDAKSYTLTILYSLCLYRIWFSWMICFIYYYEAECCFK